MFQSNNLTIQQSKEKSFRVDPRLDPREAKRSASTNKGFTLIEVIIAIFLVTIGITATLLLITKTLGAMSLSFSQLKAAYLAQEGVEVVRNIRDTNWIQDLKWHNSLSIGNCKPVGDQQGQCPINYIINYDSTEPITETYDEVDYQLYLLNVGGTDFYKHDLTGMGTPTIFKRHIEISYLEDPLWSKITFMQVKSIVTWEAKGKDYEIIVEDHLYDWK